jgi:hypothetical protein
MLELASVNKGSPSSGGVRKQGRWTVRSREQSRAPRSFVTRAVEALLKERARSTGWVAAVLRWSSRSTECGATPPVRSPPPGGCGAGAVVPSAWLPCCGAEQGGSQCTKSSANARSNVGGRGGGFYNRKTPVVRSAEKLEFSSLHNTVA